MSRKTMNIINSLENVKAKIDNELSTLVNDCTHDLVFKYIDSKPRLNGNYARYFCPECRRDFEGLTQKMYGHSRIITLPTPINGGFNVLINMATIVLNNEELYYDKEI